MTLYFFTSSFPYGHGESFIETEIVYLAKYFERIIIIPLSSTTNRKKRSTPNNCEVLLPIIRSRWQHYSQVYFKLSALRTYGKDFFKRRVYSNYNWLKMCFIALTTTNCLLKSRSLKKILSQIKTEDVMYFYWGRGFSYLLPFIKDIKVKKITRFHGSDLYDYIYNGYMPIQKEVLLATSKVICISKHGQFYIKDRFPKLNLNIEVSYLGTIDNGITRRSHDNIFRLLSCSNIKPIKRLDLLYEALQTIEGYRIYWTHIGGGKDLKVFRDLAKSSISNVKVNFLGHLSNRDVISYYQNHEVDAFINLSLSEGLPVSIMEAVSFNIPVIGTNVGGTSEVVTPETGILLPPNPNINDIVLAIDRIRHMELNPRELWERLFNADYNYKSFITGVLTT